MSPANPRGGGGGFNPSSIDWRARFLDGQKYESSALAGLEILRPQETYGSLRLPRQGRCWLFDGTDDFGTLGARLTSGSVTALTVCAWVKTTASGSARTVASEFTDTTSNRCWLAGLSSTGNPFFFVSSVGAFNASTTKQVTLSSSVNSGAWVHVAFTWTGDNQPIGYINGVSVGATNDFSGSFTSLFNTSASFLIGAHNAGGAARFPGSLRDVRVFNVAKSAAEIAAIFAGTDDPTGLLAHYPCNEESGTVGYDIGPNARHLTLTNITQATFHAADSGVSRNRNNVGGYRLSGSVYIPKRLSSDLAADGNALTVTGRSPYPAVVETPCITGDGSSVYADLGSALIPATADWELSFWYYCTDTTLRTIFSQTETTAPTGRIAITSNQGAFGFQVAGSLSLQINESSTGTNYFATATGALIIGNWHLISAARSGNDFTITCLVANGATVSNSITRATTIYTGRSTWLLGLFTGNLLANTGRVSDLRITTGGVTRYFPLQDGPGSSNNNRNLAWVASDGTSGVISNAIVNGNVSTIWGNRCPGHVKDWCVENGGGIAVNGAFVAGRIGTDLDAAGNAKTLSAGKHGNPYSRLNLNPFTAAEYNGRSIPTALAPAGSLGITPSNSAFRRTAASGDDRFLIAQAELSGSDLTSAQTYTS